MASKTATFSTEESTSGTDNARGTKTRRPGFDQVVTFLNSSVPGVRETLAKSPKYYKDDYDFGRFWLRPGFLLLALERRERRVPDHNRSLRVRRLKRGLYGPDLYLQVCGIERRRRGTLFDGGLESRLQHKSENCRKDFWRDRARRIWGRWSAASHEGRSRRQGYLRPAGGIRSRHRAGRKSGPADDRDDNGRPGRRTRSSPCTCPWMVACCCN